jgi:anti-sigma28 factor (negative regulator of flagellin synthesis)
VHQLNLKVAELKYHISDWNHKVDDKTQALIDFINDY